MSDSLRNPESVLKALSEHSSDSDYKFERLYRNLFNKQFFYAAYQIIYANPGNMTAGTDKRTAEGFTLEQIDNLIVSLRNETYQPCPARRTYIPKKNGKLRPLGIPAFNDKLVQQVVKMILEAIYEETSSGPRTDSDQIGAAIPHSHKFRSSSQELSGL